MAPKRKPPTGKKPASSAPPAPEEANTQKPRCSTRGRPSSDSATISADDSTQPVAEDTPEVQGSAESLQDNGRMEVPCAQIRFNEGLP